MNYVDIYNNKALPTNSKKVIDACCNLIKKHTGLFPYPEQIQAAKYLYKGNIVDMKTGEGKTLVCFLAILLAARDGRKVYHATSNDYLSKRDFDYSKPLLEELGIKSVFFESNIGGEENEYNSASVIYATGETLIFDYLRGIKAYYDFVIIDEIDYVLVECANHDFSVSEKTSKSDVLMPIDIFQRCLSISKILSYSIKKETIKRVDYLFDMQHEADVIVDYPKHTAEITTRGLETLQKIMGPASNDLLFLEIMNATLLAKFFFLKDVNYIVDNNEIIIISDSNGRISVGGSNDICIQTAIEIKEGVPAKAKPLLNNTCSFTVFFSIFKTLTGISGTTSLVPYDFGIIFSKSVKKVKEHFPNQRKEVYEYFADDKERLLRIEKIIKENPGPFLVVSSSDKRSNFLYESLKAAVSNKEMLILDNHTLDKEKELLERIKAENAVLFSSKIVGRGTDIALPETFEAGLVVILTERLFSERAERQIVGRTGRNGKPGTCYILTSFSDKIFNLEYKEKKIPSEKYVKKLQKRYEQNAFEMRKHIFIRSKFFFDQDKAIKDTLFSFETFEAILQFIKKQSFEIQENIKLHNCSLFLAEKAVEYNFPFLPIHKKMLMAGYEKHRPYYQQQFLQYNDMMATTLYSPEDFYFRCKDYVITGKIVMLQIITETLIHLVTDYENYQRARAKEENNNGI